LSLWFQERTPRHQFRLRPQPPVHWLVQASRKRFLSPVFAPSIPISRPPIRISTASPLNTRSFRIRYSLWNTQVLVDCINMALSTSTRTGLEACWEIRSPLLGASAEQVIVRAPTIG